MLNFRQSADDTEHANLHGLLFPFLLKGVGNA
jgi:hypothetical protein